jgi:hypothetical protein
MDRPGIIKKVLAKMDELTPFDEGLVVSPDMEFVKPVSAYIDEFLNDAASLILKILPLRVLEHTDIPGKVAIEDEVATIPLPGDFIRIAKVKFTDWKRPVLAAIPDNNPLYKLQSNPFLRAGKVKPVVALAVKDGEASLECFTTSIKDGAELKYIAKALPEQLPDDLIEPLTWQCAAIVFRVMQMPDASKLAEVGLQTYIATI